jgi:glycosyltransferase involved in cell wall biosynthesis
MVSQISAEKNSIVERILLVIDNLEFGGGERVFLQLATGLRDRFEIFVASTQGGEFESRLKELGIKLLRVDMNRRLSWRPITQIRDIIRQNKIDLVHSQGARADFFTRIAGRVAPAPCILCTLAMPVEGFDVSPLRKRIYRFMDHLTERYVDRFIVVSESLRKTSIENRGIPPQRIVKIYNGIELDQFRPDQKQVSLREHWGITPQVPLIGAIGRLVWQKGFEYLLESAPDILQVVPDARFLIVGEGPLRKRLEDLAGSLKVKERFIFSKFMSGVNDVLSNVDLVVVPSLLEGFPLVTLEAMAMAKPIVATQINGIGEQISDGEEGLLVPPKNPKALAAAVLKLVQNNELASRLGIEARRKVETYFSVEKMVGETEKVYMSALEAN